MSKFSETTFIGSRLLFIIMGAQILFTLLVGGLFLKINYDLNKLNFFKIPANYAYYIVNEGASETKEYYAKKYQVDRDRIMITEFVNATSKDEFPAPMELRLDGTVIIFNKTGRVLYKGF